MYSIFLLNKALLKYTGFMEEEKKNEKLKNLLNKLLSKGADYKNLLLITALINQGKSRVADLFYFILSRISPDYKHLFEKNNITGKIADFFNFISNSFTEDDKDDKIEVIRTILDIYLNKPEKENTHYSEIIYYDDNKFKQCRYILNENNIILSLDLSYLGNIDILIKYEKSFFSISFFCEKDESITALKSEIKLLESVLDLEGKKKMQIVFLNNKKAVEKIIEIISAIELNYLFDAKA
jgi:hypothetical protein